MKKITAALLIGLTSQAQAEIHWNVSGAFEYDHVSIQDADTTDDLTKAEITISAEIDEQVSAEIVTAGIDEETDEEATYHIVGPYEANLEQGRISTSSPIAKALIGKSVGDQAEVQTPRGPHPYEILSVEIVR